MCERKERGTAKMLREPSHSGYPLAGPSQQGWTEALPSLCAGACVLSSLRKECNQQVPQDFLLLCSCTNYFSIHPTSQGKFAGNLKLPHTHPLH